MGRGRQKAKQTKVARRLKYQSYEPDLDALQRELAGRELDYAQKQGDYGSSYEDETDEYEELARKYQ